MTFLLATINAPEIAASLATLGSMITGYLVYKASVRTKAAEAERQEDQKRTDEALKETAATAELAKVQVEGWKALIESLTNQYKTLTDQYKGSMEESAELRKRLGQGNKRFEEVTASLIEARMETSDGLSIIRRLEHEIHELRAQIDRLGERLQLGAERDVQRVEKEQGRLQAQFDNAPITSKGEKGEAGATGEQGKMGERGMIGETGHDGERGEKGDHGQPLHSPLDEPASSS